MDEGESVDAASGPNPPGHHYWSKDVGKQKGDWELEEAGWRPKETGRESRDGDCCRRTKPPLSLSRTRKLTHTSSFPVGATAHRELVDEEEELELGSSGWGARRWDGRNV